MKYPYLILPIFPIFPPNQPNLSNQPKLPNSANFPPALLVNFNFHLKNLFCILLGFGTSYALFGAEIKHFLKLGRPPRLHFEKSSIDF